VKFINARNVSKCRIWGARRIDCCQSVLLFLSLVCFYFLVCLYTCCDHCWLGIKITMNTIIQQSSLCILAYEQWEPTNLEAVIYNGSDYEAMTISTRTLITILTITITI